MIIYKKESKKESVIRNSGTKVTQLAVGTLNGRKDGEFDTHSTLNCFSQKIFQLGLGRSQNTKRMLTKLSKIQML